MLPLHRNGIKVCTKDIVIGRAKAVRPVIDSQLGRLDRDFLPAFELDTWSPRSDFANGVNKSAPDIRRPVDDIAGNGSSARTSRRKGFSPSVPQPHRRTSWH